ANRKYASFNALLKHVPPLRDMLFDPNHTPDKLAKYLRELQKRADKARNENIHDVCELVGSMAATLFPTQYISIKRAKHIRMDRGIKSPVFGYLLCPSNMDWNDSVTQQAIQQGETDISDMFFINALYENLRRGTGSLLKTGLFKSCMLVKVWCYIFTCPATAHRIPYDDIDTLHPDAKRPCLGLDGPQSKLSDRAVASIIGLTSVTPRTIAYAVVMLHFNLTAYDSWPNDKCVGGLSYTAMWNWVVDWFEAPETDADAELAKEVLTWWNERVFPKQSAAVRAAVTSGKAKFQAAEAAAQAAAIAGSTPA
ncbi:hypothetical protein CYLTODRAFT_415906, partial [Cylindrobasidium torrendii FP15055 ss-10]